MFVFYLVKSQNSLVEITIRQKSIMNDAIHKILEFTIGNIFGKDITCREPIDEYDDYQPGTVVEFGRTGLKLFKKFLMPCGLCAAVPVLKVDSASKDAPSTVSNEQQERILVRPSELPIYVEEVSSKGKPCELETPPSLLENGFGTVRRGVQGLFSEYSAITDNLNNKINTGYEHSMLMLDYLREESNAMPRLGAVGIGGLTGLIFSLRGGKFKRLVYTSTGALSVAAICYPKQAQESIGLMKHYANIGYNFVYGVKPGDANQLELKWPEMPKIRVPSSTSDFLDIASGFASTVGSAFGKVADALTGDEEKKQPPSENKPKEN